MAILANQRSEITAREYETWAHEKEMWTLQAEHLERIKQLDIEAAKLEARIVSWFKIPLTIIKLPLLILLVIPLSIYAARKQEVPAEYWKLLK